MGKKEVAFVGITILVAVLSVVFKTNTMGKPWATIIAKAQAPIQNFLRPAVWIPGLRNLHSHSESWTLPSDNNKDNLEAVLSGVMKVIEEDRSGHYWVVDKSDLQVARGFIRVFIYTRAEWLDVIEITLKGNSAQVWAFSSGFLPLCIPLACIVNLPLFWIPFLDMDFNEKRVSKIAATMPIDVDRH